MSDPKSRALERMMSDMDGMEGERMFGSGEANKAKGVDITISVVPNTGESDTDDYPEGHDKELCKGGCAYHKGGIVAPEEEDGVDESGLPPFLRKKKKSL